MSEQFDVDDESDVQMPLDTGGGATEIAFTPEKKSKYNPATLLLIGVFAAGLMLIYVLGLQSKPRAAAAQSPAESEVDSAIAELLAKKGNAEDIKNAFRDADKLVAMFNSLQNAQNHSDDRPANPFASTGGPVVAEPIAGINVNDLATQERLRKAADAFANLKLESVMMGRTAAAMINRHLVTVGSKVGDFTVTQIASDHVVLAFGAAKFELKLPKKGLDPNEIDH